MKERTENLHRIGNTAPHGISPAPVLVEHMYMVTIIFSREAQNEHIKGTFIFLRFCCPNGKAIKVFGIIYLSIF